MNEGVGGDFRFSLD